MVRSQRTSAALVAANEVAPAASASNRSLIVLALVNPSISSARLIATAPRCATARASSASSSPNDCSHALAAQIKPTGSPAASGTTNRSPTSTDGHGDRGGRPAWARCPSSAAIVSSAAEVVSGAGNSAGIEASSDSVSRSGSRPNSWQTSADSSRAMPATSTRASSSAPGADATCWASCDSSVSVFTRRRSRSYSCAFSIAPEASEAMCIISFRVSSPNSWGACVCSTMTPIVSPARDRIGTAAID